MNAARPQPELNTNKRILMRTKPPGDGAGRINTLPTVEQALIGRATQSCTSSHRNQRIPMRQCKDGFNQFKTRCGASI